MTKIPNVHRANFFNKQVFLAPMEGITDAIYRDIAVKRLDFDVICTEFVRLSGNQFHPKQLREEIKPYEGKKLSVQLMGDNPKLFAQTIPYMEEIGADIIDLNLGCPSTKVTRKGCGAAMLEDKILLSRVVSEMRKTCSVQLSCKMRAGWDGSDEAVEIAKILEGEGIDFLVVHPRTKVQNYNGKANWNIIKDIVDELSIPVIGNGDIFTVQNAIDMIDLCECSGVMLGRGVLRNPFLISYVKNFFSFGTLNFKKELSDYVSFYRDFYANMLSAGKSEKSISGKLKEHMASFKEIVQEKDAFWEKVKYTREGYEIIEIMETSRLIC